MMCYSVKGYQFTNSEFIMMALILGATEIIAISDPDNISKMNETELNEKWNQLKKSLKEKEYIKDETEDVLLIDDDVNAILNAYINATRIINIKVTEKGNSIADELIFYSNTGSCSLVTDKSMQNVLFAYTYENETVISQCIIKHSASLPHVDSFDMAEAKSVMNRKQYFEFVAAVNMRDIHKATDLLVATGMKTEIAEDAVQGYYNKDKFISVMFTEIFTGFEEGEYNPEISMFYFGKCFVYAIVTTENDEQIFSVQALTKGEFINGIKEVLAAKLYGVR